MNESRNVAFEIRGGTEADLPRVFELVKELALFERAPEEVDNSVERMKKDGFGPDAVFGFLVATLEETIVGISIYYFRYSTWKGKSLYLEDLIVTEQMRGNGIGKALFDATVQKGKELGCVQMNWQVLDWNTDAIEFYKLYGSTIEDGWLNASIPLK